jgi:hypothetical protein
MIFGSICLKKNMRVLNFFLCVYIQYLAILKFSKWLPSFVQKSIPRIWWSLPFEGVTTNIEKNYNLMDRLWSNHRDRFSTKYVHIKYWPSQCTIRFDNARLHRSRAVTAYFQSEAVTSLPWPGMGPHLNPIEHAWNMLGRRETPVPNLRELKYVHIKYWPSQCTIRLSFHFENVNF